LKVIAAAYRSELMEDLRAARVTVVELPKLATQVRQVNAHLLT
jgi:hypothetical protein